jgi:hypothetical protein
MTEEFETLPVLQTDTHVRGARKDDDAQGFDGAVKRPRHVNTHYTQDRPCKVVFGPALSAYAPK